MSAALAGAGIQPDAEPCVWCGEPRTVAIFEMWDDGHDFMLETCCPGALEEFSAGIADNPGWGRDLLRRLGAEHFAGHRLRRVADDGTGGLMLDYRLQVRPIAFTAACAFVGRHHAHVGPPVAWRFGSASTTPGSCWAW